MPEIFVQTLIYKPSMEKLHAGLTDSELDTLDGFLAAPIRENTTMDVATLEGFMAALAIGPETILPSQWLPWVWDLYGGEAEAQFEDLDEANRIMQLVMRFYNQLVQQFTDNPQGFEPIYWRSTEWGQRNGAKASCSAPAWPKRHGLH